MKLYTYFRSSSAYRVRIALGLKGIKVDPHFVHLTQDGGQQHALEFRAVNPEGLVPVLEDGSVTITQSLAILEYLDERYPEVPLLPSIASDRAWVRSLALQIACDISPLTNLRVLQYLERSQDLTSEDKQAWIVHWMGEGLAALEAHLGGDSRTGEFCFGNSPTIADCCLVPQVFNARRFGIPLDQYPTLVRIDAHLTMLPVVQSAAPDAQRDAS
nr:maleylacetoacetate isomerase at Glutathione S-transferase, zeta [uncultured bacterium]